MCRCQFVLWPVSDDGGFMVQRLMGGSSAPHCWWAGPQPLTAGMLHFIWTLKLQLKLFVSQNRKCKFDISLHSWRLKSILISCTRLNLHLSTNLVEDMFIVVQNLAYLLIKIKNPVRSQWFLIFLSNQSLADSEPSIGLPEDSGTTDFVLNCIVHYTLSTKVTR